MGLYKPERTDWVDGGEALRLKKPAFDRFSQDVLGLGDLGAPSEPREALCALFDLAGFTDFSKQIDPHLAVPEFLSSFLKWLFAEIKKGAVAEDRGDSVELWFPLPFLAKFMGDGVLFLWNTEDSDPVGNCNTVVRLYEICQSYRTDFLPKARRRVVDPPTALRCGVARGRVLSVGNGTDFVGPCINLAARLQKLSLLTFCFSRRGFDPDAHMPSSKGDFELVQVAVRGIGDRELVYVLKEELDALPPDERKQFRNPS